MRENRYDKRRIIQLIREANYEREGIVNEESDLQEIMGLYGYEAYIQKG
jgi:hypothetical protein